MADPTLRQLRTLVAVLDAGSVSAAARHLGITQPAASQQLRDLERALGLRLLTRTGGRVLPTAAGEALLPPVRRTLAAVADAQAVAAGFRSGETGRVRIGTGATACIHLLPAALGAAKRAMPGLEVIVATGNTARMIRQVEADTLDLALVTLPVPAARSLSVTPLLRDDLLAVIPAGMAGPGPVDAAMLAALPLILYERGGSTRTLIDAWFRAAGVTPAPVMQLDSVETIKVLVSGGAGASVLPALALAEGVAGAEVRPLTPPASRGLGVVLRREKVVDRGLRAMLGALEAVAGGAGQGMEASVVVPPEPESAGPPSRERSIQGR
jgi:DNA-binding transcriptional LysR family regulator